MAQLIEKSSVNRRQFLKQSSSLAAGAAVLWSLPPTLFAAADDTIRLAGGRGAVGDALCVSGSGPVKPYAMADPERGRMEASFKALREKFPDKVDVAEDRKFVGPCAGEEAQKTGVKVAAGLQCRHSPARQVLIEKIRAGEMGEIPLIRANRFGGGGGLGNQGENTNKLMSQLQFRKIHLLWVGAGHMVNNLIHQIDDCCWIKDASPIAADGLGGRSPRSAGLIAENAESTEIEDYKECFLCERCGLGGKKALAVRVERFHRQYPPRSAPQ